MSQIKQQLLALNKTSKKSVALYHKLALLFGLSDSALGILYALLEADAPCTQYDLCNEWSLPKQTINTTVCALQKKGFICLAPMSGARNKKSIVLTEAGRNFATATVGMLRDLERSALLELTLQEREIYVQLNDKYNNVLSKKLCEFLNTIES